MVKIINDVNQYPYNQHKILWVLAMEPPTLEGLLKKYKITKNSKQQVSDDHLREIALSYCKDWKKLPSLLGLESIVADDIDRSGKEEGGKRHDFLLKWKSLNGSSATYKQLIGALLKIRCVDDAEKVCSLPKKSIPAAPLASSLATPKPSTGILIGGGGLNLIAL